MTDDIVARLRSAFDARSLVYSQSMCDEAADEIERLRSRVRLLEGYLNGALDMIEKFVACDTSDARVALYGEKKDG